MILMYSLVWTVYIEVHLRSFSVLKLSDVLLWSNCPAGHATTSSLNSEHLYVHMFWRHKQPLSYLPLFGNSVQAGGAFDYVVALHLHTICPPEGGREQPPLIIGPATKCSQMRQIGQTDQHENGKCAISVFRIKGKSSEHVMMKRKHTNVLD